MSHFAFSFSYDTQQKYHRALTLYWHLLDWSFRYNWSFHFKQFFSVQSQGKWTIKVLDKCWRYEMQVYWLIFAELELCNIYVTELRELMKSRFFKFSIPIKCEIHETWQRNSQIKSAIEKSSFSEDEQNFHSACYWL